MPSEPAAAPGERRQSDDADTDTGTDAGGDGDGVRSDGGNVPQAHTVRLELDDEPGQLLAALQPIAENGGNLLSVYHERGNVTPRGRIPVEVDLECAPDRFDAVLEGLREHGVTVTSAGTEEYGGEVTVVLVGHLIETDLSDTLQRLTECANAAVADIDLSAASGTGTGEPSSARVRLRTREGRTADVLDSVRTVADDKGFDVIEPVEGRR
ncbi:allosteric regulator of homoserine dehydrogenase [Candidatus Halobonum tyrrellensis]|uniref:Allosteric regulator of homoserine dehydrogenase n=1 Tax=Candidatus Halobonum tyrrellensis G22 TaxID=1324957 RepID=V4HI44_9EURY|nr:allosteric regulator of homoserine dehydrogenase [Candidatus Halobonum tyrrellensis]ESP87589.1 allosteric regulator of homoserine dehydrogenase [Candidatus Halobonum tyrrellensis G22]